MCVSSFDDNSMLATCNTAGWPPTWHPLPVFQGKQLQPMLHHKASPAANPTLNTTLNRRRWNSSQHHWGFCHSSSQTSPLAFGSLQKQYTGRQQSKVSWLPGIVHQRAIECAH